MNTIVNPITQIPYSIFSENGKNVLKSYILLFQSGGSEDKDNSENNGSDSGKFNKKKWMDKWMNKGVPVEKLKKYLEREQTEVDGWGVKNRERLKLLKNKLNDTPHLQGQLNLLKNQPIHIHNHWTRTMPTSWVEQDQRRQEAAASAAAK
jgi:hypothetical protein